MLWKHLIWEEQEIVILIKSLISVLAPITVQLFINVIIRYCIGFLRANIWMNIWLRLQRTYSFSHLKMIPELNLHYSSIVSIFVYFLSSYFSSGLWVIVARVQSSALYRNSSVCVKVSLLTHWLHFLLNNSLTECVTRPWEHICSYLHQSEGLAFCSSARVPDLWYETT